jgi:hypothetical protein
MNKIVRTISMLAVGALSMAYIGSATAGDPDNRKLVKPAPAPTGNTDQKTSATTPGDPDNRIVTAAPDGASAPTPAPATPGGPDDRKPAAPKA